MDFDDEMMKALEEDEKKLVAMGAYDSMPPYNCPDCGKQIISHWSPCICKLNPPQKLTDKEM